jgi:hypothetical protein
MTILNEGINKIRDLTSSSISAADWGTGTTAPTTTDTGLQTEIVGVDQSVTKTTASKTINITAVLPSTSANGSTVSEHVIRFSSGEDLFRQTFTPISKTTSKELHNISTFVIQQG